MTENDRDEFYVGYLPTAPARVAHRTIGAVIVFVGLAVVVAIVLVVGQREATGGTFEFQVYRDFTGILVERPYPTLLVERPNADRGEPYSRYLLVGAGKHGATVDVAGFDGKRVTLQGSLIFRDEKTMIELVPESVRSASTAPATLPSGDREELGTVTLAGEIVDSKCYLGVMSPGSAKPHRACAVRCISGGAPPLLIVTGGSIVVPSALLVSASGEAVTGEVLDYVAEPVEITGRLVREGDRHILFANPSTIKRRD